jgi:short-subunit dehydrogenase
LHHIACDLSRAAEIERAGGEVRAFLERAAPTGAILLINNSGFGAFGRFPEPSLARELEMIDVNVRAVVHFTGLLLPLLKQRGGAIMNIASTVAFQPTPNAATYGATKAFVLNWTVALNEELRGSGARALAVCPGTTRTEFFRNAGVGDATKAPFAMTCEEVVEIALRALGAGRVQVVAGWRNKLMTFAGAKVSKPFAARVSGRILARVRGLDRR